VWLPANWDSNRGKRVMGHEAVVGEGGGIATGEYGIPVSPRDSG
jgi:hypothetical protein